MKVDVFFETDIEVEVTVEAVCSRGYPPPPCSDHDHPNFSDPGEPDEVEELSIFLTRKDRKGKTVKLDITQFVDSYNSTRIDDEAIEQMLGGE
jgi:hypothetical protein